jgi:DNA-binding NarL/FixJ family response regulator
LHDIERMSDFREKVSRNTGLVLMDIAAGPRVSGKMNDARVRVVIADDHAIVREGLRLLIDAQPGMTVVGEASNGEEAWQRCGELRPHVLVLDLSMPGSSGASAAERIADDYPAVKILVLTMHEERGYVQRLLRAGATGYVLKRTAAAELVRAIAAVARGGTYVDPSLAGVLLAEQSTRVSGERKRRGLDLTGRETEVLQLVARGYSNKEIGPELQISVKTVESHKANGMAKLGVRSRAELVRFAVSEHWLDASDR